MQKVKYVYNINDNNGIQEEIFSSNEDIFAEDNEEFEKFVNANFDFGCIMLLGIYYLLDKNGEKTNNFLIPFYSDRKVV